MAQPQWATDAGHLATIPVGVFYSVQLVATDPAHPMDPTAVTYRVIAGALPLGIECTAAGLLTGVPYVTGNTATVNSRFVVRAGTATIPPRFSDRTFDFTVIAQAPPVFVTPAGNVGTFYDGGPIAPIQIATSDPNPGSTVVVTLAAGTLPPGLSLSATGLITGYITPLVPVNQLPGFDATPFDQYAYDFAVNSLSTNYQFTLEANDGRETTIRTFEIYVVSRSSLTADTTEFTADNTFITADQTNLYSPFLTNAITNSPLVPLTADNIFFRADNTFITADQTEVYAPIIAGGYINNLGTVRSDNFWAYQFVGLDFDGDMIEYLPYPGPGLQLPPGTTLDPVTGWLYGYLPNLGVTQITFDFGIYVRKTYNTQYRSDPYYFSLTLVGAVNTDVTWLTAPNLGTIINGSTSTLAVVAINTLGGRPLQYRLLPGSYPVPNIGVYNKLPQGLELLPSGEIAGRVSFNTFALDLGTTTFDRGTTTFDSVYTFTVNAYSQDGVISVYRTFTITVIREYNEPYENLYIKCMPPQSNRDLINQLIQNQDIIPIDLVYRADDPNFGVATNVIYHHAYGLTAATYSDYVSSLNINHYWKNLVLGSIKTAQALDDAGNVLYEVVYSEVIDDLVNDAGASVSKSVTLPYPVTLPDTSVVSTVYPNSLINMRDQVIDSVGQISKLLPRWMLSKQANGQVLGFTPAWVIAYCKPGRSGQVAYNISQQFGEKLNLVDFEVDRYELDRLLTKNWDPVVRRWVNTPPTPVAATTFDLLLHYELAAIGNYYYSPYVIGDEILILGSQVGGQDGINNITIRVQTIDTSGGIVTAVIQGQAPLGTLEQTFDSIVGTTVVGTGNGAIFNLVVGSGVATTFDAGSMVFEAPVDMYSNTDAYDRYLVFPRRNILTPPPNNINPNLLVGWQNNTGQQVGWKNDSDQPVGWKDFI